MSREAILHRIRAALGRSAGAPAADAPPARIRIPVVTAEDRIRSARARIEALGGETFLAATREEARAVVAAAIEGKSAVVSNAPYLADCGIPALPGVRCGITDPVELRRLCASTPAGITSADYVLADTGTLVLLSSVQEAREISLLPPAHIAVVPRSRILTGLDELFSVLPRPADLSSSMVLITGPSRTADIEQFLVRGVHGPGRLTVIFVEE